MLDHIEHDARRHRPRRSRGRSAIPGDFRGVIDRRDGTLPPLHAAPRAARRGAVEEAARRGPQPTRARPGSSRPPRRSSRSRSDVAGPLRRRAPRGRRHHAGAFRFGALELRRARCCSTRCIELRAGAGPAARRRARRGRSRRRSPVSCSRCRRTWTRATATGSPSCASARGTFERGMRPSNARTGRPFALRSRARDLRAGRATSSTTPSPATSSASSTPTDVRVGDTLYVRRARRVPAHPDAAPEHFVYVHNRDASRSKQFRRGLVAARPGGRRAPPAAWATMRPSPVLGAVGPLQFDVASTGSSRVRRERRLEPARLDAGPPHGRGRAAALSGRRARAALAVATARCSPRSRTARHSSSSSASIRAPGSRRCSPAADGR